MPHPIKNLTGLAARGGPRIILERPKLAALVGAIASEWGDIDDILSDIFNFVSLSKSVPYGAHSHSKLAEIIFDSVISFPARLEMIENVIRLRMDQQILNDFISLSRDIRSKSKLRNRLVHDGWQICDQYPDDLIRITRDGDWIRYTENDLEFNLSVSVEIRNRVHDFCIRAAHAPKKDV